jgi:hypothetical protein
MRLGSRGRRPTKKRVLISAQPRCMLTSDFSHDAISSKHKTERWRHVNVRMQWVTAHLIRLDEVAPHGVAAYTKGLLRWWDWRALRQFWHGALVVMTRATHDGRLPLAGLAARFA